MAGIYARVEPEKTRIFDEIHVGWRSREDGGPAIRVWYRNDFDDERNEGGGWVLLEFREVLLFRYHNEHLELADSAWGHATYEERSEDRADVRSRIRRYPWVLRRGEETALKRLVVEHLKTGGGDWCGVPAAELHHYRLMHDHDGYYDVICTGLGISEYPSEVADEDVDPRPPFPSQRGAPEG
jgi:hypothetical protein